MAKVLHQGASGTNSRAASATGYARLTGNGRHTVTSGESGRTTLWRTTGVLSNLYINILTNDRGASTFRTRKASADANLVVSITASTTGGFEDTSNSDVVTAGEEWHSQIITGAGGTVFTYDVDSVIFSANTNTVLKFGGGDGSSVTAASTTEPINPYGNSKPLAGGADSDAGQTMRTAGTLKNLYLYTNSNARTTTTTFRSRVNSAFGNLTLSVTAGATGSFEDTSNSDTIASGDLVNFSVTTDTGTEALALSGITAEFETTNSMAQYVAGNEAGSTQLVSVTTYYPFAGFLGASTTEANKTIEANLPFTASLLQINVTANTISDSSTLRLRKNSADGNQVVTITGSTTGIFQDTTNSDFILATDDVNYSIVTGATGTSLVLRSISTLGLTNVSVSASTTKQTVTVLTNTTTASKSVTKTATTTKALIYVQANATTASVGVAIDNKTASTTKAIVSVLTNATTASKVNSKTATLTQALVRVVTGATTASAGQVIDNKTASPSKQLISVVAGTPSVSKTVIKTATTTTTYISVTTNAVTCTAVKTKTATATQTVIRIVVNSTSGQIPSAFSLLSVRLLLNSRIEKRMPFKSRIETRMDGNSKIEPRLTVKSALNV
jgi:hypothetical protein